MFFFFKKTSSYFISQASCWKLLEIGITALTEGRGGGDQSPLSMEFPRQEYWSGLSFPSPRRQFYVWDLFVSVCSDYYHKDRKLRKKNSHQAYIHPVVGRKRNPPALPLSPWSEDLISDSPGYLLECRSVVLTPDSCDRYLGSGTWKICSNPFTKLF